MALLQHRGHLVLALIILMISAFRACAAELPNPFPPRDISVSTLENGLRLVVKADHTLPVVALAVTVRSGSAAETQAQGQAHLLEHLVFQGTKRYPAPLQAQQALEQAGGISDAVTSRDAIRFQAAIASDQAELLVRVLYDVVMAPLLTDERFEQERPVVLAEIQREDDNPIVAAIAGAYRISYRAHPYRFSPSGSIQDLLRMTAGDVRAFHQRWFGSKNISLVFVGDITPARAKEIVAGNFGLVKPVPLSERPPAETTLFETPMRHHAPTTLPGTCQAMAFPAPASADFTRMVATDVLLTLLVDGPDALLSTWYAGRGLSPTRFGGEFVSTRAPGRLILWADTPVEQAAPMRDATLTLLRRIYVGDVDDEALELARKRLVMSFVLENETYSQQAATLAFYESLGGAHLASRYVPALEALTFAQVCDAAPTDLLGWVTVGKRPEGGL
ncbi:MAG: Protease 3 precursor [bacterium ADurb.Bin429]|nr:MAG: Protease 3 precursor [bacterium ADurb.Bin429]